MAAFDTHIQGTPDPDPRRATEPEHPEAGPEPVRCVLHGLAKEALADTAFHGAAVRNKLVKKLGKIRNINLQVEN
jgi:hypothetical protein